MRRTKRIIDVHFTERRHLLGQVKVILLLAFVEAGIFEHDHVTGFQRFGNRFHLRANAIRRHGYRATQQRSQRI